MLLPPRRADSILDSINYVQDVLPMPLQKDVNPGLIFVYFYILQVVPHIDVRETRFSLGWV